MDPMVQWLIDAVIGVILAIGGGFLVMVFSMMRDHVATNLQEAAKLEELRVRLAEKYVMREELEKMLAPIFVYLRRIEDKVDGRGYGHREGSE